MGEKIRQTVYITEKRLGEIKAVAEKRNLSFTRAAGELLKRGSAVEQLHEVGIDVIIKTPDGNINVADIGPARKPTVSQQLETQVKKAQRSQG